MFLTPQLLKQQCFRKRVLSQGAGRGDTGKQSEPEEMFSIWPFTRRIINEHLLCVRRRPRSEDTVGNEERGTNSRGAAGPTLGEQGRRVGQIQGPFRKWDPG